MLCLADVRMRSERFEYLRRRLDAELLRLTRAGRADEARMDVRKPWDCIFLAAAEDEDYWGAAVKEKALLYMSSLRSRPELVDEGHHVIVPGAPGGVRAGEASGGAAPLSRRAKAKAAAKKKEREADKKKEKEHVRDRTPPAPKPKDRRAGPKGEGKGKDPKPRAEQICWKWVHDVGGCADVCPDNRLHPVCPKCRRAHPHRSACP